MIDLTPAVEALFAFLAALISIFVIPYIKTKLSAEKQQTIEKWVNIAVAAAEMIYPESGKGEAKKVYVFHFLKDKGLALDDDVIDALIEAAVYRLKNTFTIGEAVLSDE